tara:strand:+ start:211 stop:369 length:159 start_codon:yes stop_codon:yes gene_type:complete
MGAFQTGDNWADSELAGSGQPVHLADIKRGAIAMSASAPVSVNQQRKMLYDS